MKKHLHKINLLILVAVLPMMYGCLGGGGIGALTSLLFGSSAIGGGIGGGLGPVLGPGGPGGPGGIIAAGAITNPEPASMLLLGSGMMAMAYYKKRRNRNKN